MSKPSHDNNNTGPPRTQQPLALVLVDVRPTTVVECNNRPRPLAAVHNQGELWLACYGVLVVCILACTATAIVLAATSLSFLDFESGLNRVPGNVLSVANNTEGTIDCAVYPASCSTSAVYATYFRRWHVGPLAKANAWTAVGIGTIAADIAEAAYLLVELSSWDTYASAASELVPTLSFRAAPVAALAAVLLLRATCNIVLYVVTHRLRKIVGKTLPHFVRMTSNVMWFVTTAGSITWVIVAAIIQNNLLCSFCLRISNIGYVMGIVFSFVPGIVAIPMSIKQSADADTCSLAGAEDADVFLTLPLVVSWIDTTLFGCVVVLGCLVLCIVAEQRSMQKT